METDVVEIPESVHAYLTDAGVRAATNMLLESDIDEPVAGLTWSEIGDYQRALLAACQVRTEYVETMEALWLALWQDAIPRGWSAVDPDEHIEEYVFEPSLETFWGAEIYARVHRRANPNRYLYSMVSITPDGTQIGFALWDDTDDARIPSFEDFDVDDGFLWSQPVEIVKDSRSLDLDPLKRMVERALGAVSAAL